MTLLNVDAGVTPNERQQAIDELKQICVEIGCSGLDRDWENIPWKWISASKCLYFRLVILRPPTHLSVPGNMLQKLA